MQFPESWLREFCNPPLDTDALADTLTMGGFEVEEVRPVAPPFAKVVVGAITAAAQHPDADRLRVCTVDVGEAEPLQIVCGAPNARVGIKVPCALVGAELPPGEDGKPFRIKLGKLRGVQSQGMLCSARELGLSEDASGLLELDANAPVGQDLREALHLDDAVFTLKLTPNLGHALSVYGVARELSALTGAPLVTPAPQLVAPRGDGVLPVSIGAPDLCGRFSGRVVRGVDPTARTPAWMVDRLARCGQRSVTALVDISNYVMFEFGQPTHIFDLDRIDGGLDVRWAREGETLKLLNGASVTLDPTVGVIADRREVESLAGIMGGDATAVSDDTRNVYVEAAFWWPQAVAGRSRRFNFATDAGHRFERGVDPALTVAHLERVTRLIVDICGTPQTVCGPIDDHQARMPAPAPIALRVARAARVLGMPLSVAQCADVFRRLGLAFTERGGVFTVTPPSYRFDLRIEEDLIEELARVIGYGGLPESPPLAPIVPTAPPANRRGAFAVRRALAALGYLETINFSFVEQRWESELAGNEDPVRLLNPIASQMSVMRSSLMGSLLQVVKHNVDRRAERVRVFEVGRVFRRDPAVTTGEGAVAGIAQPMHVAAAAYGPARPQGWGGKQALVDFYDVKGDLQDLLAPRKALFEAASHPALHPGRTARVVIDGQPVGFIGELHPRWRQRWALPHAPVLFEVLLDSVAATTPPLAHAVPRLHPAERDIAVVVDDAVTHEQLMRAIAAADTRQLLADATLFDIYRPGAAGHPAAGGGGSVQPGEKSLAVRLTLVSAGDALTDERIDEAVAAVVASLQTTLGARLRA